jgi:DNA-binding FadR family transcriptional regulator
MSAAFKKPIVTSAALRNYTGMMRAKPQTRRKLSEAVIERLLERIRTHRLKPGDRLPSERQLMSEYDVGRPAIREALQQLEHLGLVEIRHGGRARMAEPSLSQIVEQLSAAMRHLLTNSSTSLENLKESRLMFETGMVRIAAKKRSAGDVARLRAVLEAERAALGDRERFVTLDGEFHREIAAMSGNPIFAVVCEAIFQWLADFYRGAVSVPGLEELTLREHEQIITAIEAGDAGAAGDRMADHLLRANELYRQQHYRDRI